jgi:hypothetical protein
MSNVTRVTISPDGSAKDETGNEIPAPTDGDFGHGVQDGALLSVDNEGNVTRSGGLTRVQVSPHSAAGDTVLSTARSASNRSVSGPDLLKPGVTVECIPGNEGSRTLISCAVDHGYLSQDQVGNYKEVGTSPDVIEAQQRETQRAADAQREAANAFSPSVEAVYQEALSAVHPGTFASTVNSMMEDGSASIANVNAIADQTGKSRQEVVAMLGTLMHAFDGKTVEATTKAGLAASDTVDFARWAQQHRKDEWLEARLLMAHGRDGRKITAMAREYLTHNPPSEAALNAAGFKTFTKSGTLFIEFPDERGIISVGSAARLGWL